MNGLIALGAGICSADRALAAVSASASQPGIETAEAISRQPEASGKIQTNLLLGAALAEGTAISAVVALLIILFWSPVTEARTNADWILTCCGWVNASSSCMRCCAQVPVQACSGLCDRKAPADSGRKPGRCRDLQKEAAETMNAAQEKLHPMWTMRPLPLREAYEQAEVEKQQLLADARKRADAIVAAGKASAEAERQSKLREKPMPRPRHWPVRCAKLLARNPDRGTTRLLDDLLEKAGAGNGSKIRS